MSDKELVLGVGLVAYNDAACLPRCLDSLKNFDHVICCEGKYDVNQCGLAAHSTDGTIEIIKSYENTVLLDCAGMKQTAVRNMYMEEAARRGCDWLLVMECDEYVTNTMKTFFRKTRACRLDRFKENLPQHGRRRSPRDLVYNVLCEEVGAASYYFQSPRLIYRPECVRYGGVHHSYVVGENERLAFNNNTLPVVSGIVVHHDESPRTKERQLWADRYGKGTLTEQEKQARAYLVDNCLFL